MTDTTAATNLAATPSSATPGRRGPRFDVKRQGGFGVMAMFCLLMLYAPMFVLVAYAFNDNQFVMIWKGFSWRWFGIAVNDPEIRGAALLSLKVAAIASVTATIIATMAALVTTRVKPFRSLPLVYAIVNQPLMVPEIVTAIATMVFFAWIKTVTQYQGLIYLVVSHIVFCIPFAYMPLRARLEDMDLTFENAAADLYATPWQVFRRVTFPLMIPGIIGALMLSFVISMDDVVITVHVSGPGEETLPLYLIGQLHRGVTPEVNAMSTLFLLASVLLVTIFFIVTRKKT
ncbi:MAG TPA: ABC transporter permease [Dongiaceae bacterium]|nr:ABC transporter permease [Dongiaceae bacterium]